MNHDTFEAGAAGFTALMALLNSAAFLACLRYRRLSRYTYLMMAGFAGCVLVGMVSVLFSFAVRSANYFDHSFTETLVYLPLLVEVVAWGLAVGGLAGTLAAAERRIRLLTLSQSPTRPADPAPADQTVLWDPSHEAERGPRA